MGNYDEDTAFLGQKGPFFALLFFLLNAIYISTGFHGLYIVFVGASPSHRCQVADGNLSEEWTRASIPKEMVNGKLQPSQCWRYSLETVRNLSAQGYSPQDVNLTDLKRETCADGWSYSTDVYHSTIVSEVRTTKTKDLGGFVYFNYIYDTVLSNKHNTYSMKRVRMRFV